MVKISLYPHKYNKKTFITALVMSPNETTYETRSVINKANGRYPRQAAKSVRNHVTRHEYFPHK